MAPRGDKSANILREAGTAESWSRIKEFSADAIIETHSAGYFLYIGADLFAEVRNFIDECDLRGKECVGRVLDELRSAARRIEDGHLV